MRNARSRTGSASPARPWLRSAFPSPVSGYANQGWSGARDPLEGLEAYRALVDARWTLVDACERNGTRYVVARENQAALRGLGALTDRERQVAVYVSLGRTTKEIAYALGIASSTVRVLLSRAISRLRVRSRDQLVRKVTADALPELDARKSAPTR